MKTIELIQMIRDEICEGCGYDADCGEDPNDCSRIAKAASWLVDWVAAQQAPDPKEEKGCCFCCDGQDAPTKKTYHCSRCGRFLRTD